MQCAVVHLGSICGVVETIVETLLQFEEHYSALKVELSEECRVWQVEAMWGGRLFNAGHCSTGTLQCKVLGRPLHCSTGAIAMWDAAVLGAVGVVGGQCGGGRVGLKAWLEAQVGQGETSTFGSQHHQDHCHLIMIMMMIMLIMMKMMMTRLMIMMMTKEKPANLAANTTKTIVITTTFIITTSMYVSIIITTTTSIIVISTNLIRISIVKVKLPDHLQ